MKHKIKELDILRIIGFILVVDQHILGAYAGRVQTSFFDSMVLNLLYLIGRPAVAMFIAITAMTLFYTSCNGFNVKKFYSKKLMNIVAPYLVWSFIYIAVFKKYHMLDKLTGILLTGMASYHLWYMGMVIRIYIWFPLMLYVTKKAEALSPAAKKLGLAIFFVSYWIILKNNNNITAYISNLIFKTPSELQHKFVMYCPIFWSAYFVLGTLIIYNYERFKHIIIQNKGKLCAIYFMLLAYMYYAQICSKLPKDFPIIHYEHALYILYMIASILLMYTIALYASEKLNKVQAWLETLGNLSFTAYLAHVILLQHIAGIQRSYLPIQSYLLSGLLIIFATVAASFILSYLLSFIPYSNILFGVKHKPIIYPTVSDKKRLNQSDLSA